MGQDETRDEGSSVRMPVLDRLGEMFELQKKLQLRLKTIPFKSNEARIQFIRVMTLANIDEIMEYLREFPWKPWKVSQILTERNIERAKMELVDEFHFFMNRCIAVDMDADELYRLYCVKNGINHKRQDEGY